MNVYDIFEGVAMKATISLTAVALMIALTVATAGEAPRTRIS